MLNNFLTSQKGQFAGAFGICVVLTGVATLVSNTSNPDYAVTLRLSHARTAGSIADLTAYKFKELLEQNSQKQIGVTVYPNNGLSGGDQSRSIDLLKGGNIDIQICSATDLYNVDNRFGTFWMPFLFENDQQIEYFVNNEKVNDTLDSWLQPHGLDLLAMYSAGARQISNNVHEITSPEDLDGIKFRVPPFEGALTTFEALGAQAVKMDFISVKKALENNEIQGLESTVQGFISSKLYKDQPFLTLWNGIYDTQMWIANEKSLAALNDDQRAAFTDSLHEAIAWRTNLYTEFNKLYLKTLAERGVKITQLTPEQVAAFRAKAEPIYQRYVETLGLETLNYFLQNRGPSDAELQQAIENNAQQAAAETAQTMPEMAAPAEASPDEAAPVEAAPAEAAPVEGEAVAQAPAEAAPVEGDAVAAAPAEGEQAAAPAQAAPEAAAEAAPVEGEAVAAAPAPAGKAAVAIGPADQNIVEEDQPAQAEEGEITITEVTVVDPAADIAPNLQQEAGLPETVEETTDDAAVEALAAAQEEPACPPATEEPSAGDVQVPAEQEAAVAQAPVPAPGVKTLVKDTPKVAGFKPVYEDVASVSGFAPIIQDIPSVQGFDTITRKVPVYQAPSGFDAPAASAPAAAAPAPAPQVKPLPPHLKGAQFHQPVQLQYVPVGESSIQYIEIAPGKFQAVQMIPVQPIAVEVKAPSVQFVQTIPVQEPVFVHPAPKHVAPAHVKPLPRHAKPLPPHAAPEAAPAPVYAPSVQMDRPMTRPAHAPAAEEFHKPVKAPFAKPLPAPVPTPVGPAPEAAPAPEVIDAAVLTPANPVAVEAAPAPQAAPAPEAAPAADVAAEPVAADVADPQAQTAAAEADAAQPMTLEATEAHGPAVADLPASAEAGVPEGAQVEEPAPAETNVAPEAAK